jgi:putative ABC transport system permease protein
MRSLNVLTWRNLSAHRLRSTLTALAIALGVGMVLAAAIVGQAASRQATQLADEPRMGNVLLVQAGLAVVGLIILFAAGFVILNAFAMSVTGRMREIGAMRALGMTRRQVMRGVLAEAGLIGSIGTVAGVLIGLGLAWAMMQAMGTLKEAPLTVPLWGLALSTLMGLAVTLIAALQPAWRASRVSPIVAARPEATAAAGWPHLRWGWYVRSGGRVGAAILGLLLPGLAAYGLLARPDVFTAQAVMVVGQAALLGATVLLLPAVIDPVTALARPLLVRWLGAEGRLAADNLGRNKLRTVLTAGALTAGLTIIIATSGLMTAGLKGSLSRLGAMMHEDSFVVADIAKAVSSGEFSVDNFFQAISQIPSLDLTPVLAALDPLVESGVIEVERNRFVPIPPEVTAIPGAPGIFVDSDIFLRIGNFCFFEGSPETALEWLQRGRAVLLQPIVAERLGVQVGDAIPVQTPHGEIEFTVAGIGGSGYAMTVFSYADGETYFDVTTPTHLGIVVAEGQDVEAALAQVAEAIEPFPEMILHDYDNSFDPLLEMIDRLELLLDALLLLAVVVAALGVVNTMVINVTERRREIGLLRAVGATQRQVRRAVVAEAATLGLLAALVASGIGLLMLLTWGLLVLPNGTNSLGVRPDWETIRLTMGAGLRDLGLAAAVSLIFGPLVAGLAAHYPARRAAAMEIVKATRSEQVTL